MVTRPGFGTVIPGANLPPTPPAPVAPEVLDALVKDLSMPHKPPRDDEDRRGSHDQDNDPGHKPPMNRPDGEQGEAAEGTHHTRGPARHRAPTPEDMEAWKTGDPEVRQALMEKYGAKPEGTQPGMPPMWNTATGPMTFEQFQQMFEANMQGDFNPEFYNQYLQQFMQQTATAAQQAAQTAGVIQDGVALRTQLAQVQTGQFHFARSGQFVQNLCAGLPSNYLGTMDVLLNIDFGNRTVGGGGSHLYVNTTANGGTINQNMPIGPQGFGQGAAVTPLAIYKQTVGPLTGEFIVQNQGGVIGATLDAGAVYHDTTQQNHGQGMLQDIPRSDGLQ
jgi:hypothetical protein